MSDVATNENTVDGIPGRPNVCFKCYLCITVQNSRFLYSYTENLYCTISQPQHRHWWLLCDATQNEYYAVVQLFLLLLLWWGIFKNFAFICFLVFFLLSFCWCHCWYISDGGGNVLFKMLLIKKIYNLFILEISLINMATSSAYRHGGVCEELNFKQKSRIFYSYKHRKLVKTSSS